MTVRQEAPAFAWQEALAFAEAGCGVAVFAETWELAQNHLRDFEEILDDKQVEKIIRAYGRQVIHFHSGGTLCFYSTRSIPRGRALDRLYVPIASLRPEIMERIAPLVVTSKEPAIVGYFD
ncbi:hypothetical protein PBI_RYAN_2 [Arthrobacter phage Ryan]|uniref:Uncharacterized protein n=1 Tax=Arthrobacter phage Ryan TaxID=2419968 RepID=A0A3G2KJ01_9CAUD|nr:hypothetical protein QEO75_gp02 [Arthrobacter phage Ryan]AYN58996.1 hypothetical protein PBI_RYAN_2 [Arthrobacter phage Ryan]